MTKGGDSMKKILCLMLMSLITMWNVSAGAFAFVDKSDTLSLPTGGMIMESEYVGIYDPPESDNSGSILLKSEQSVSFEELMVSKCSERAESIDVSAYNITIDNYLSLYCDFVMRHPELMLVTGCGHSVSSEDANLVTKITPWYLNTNKAEDDEARLILENKVNELAALADGIEDPVGKLLIVHDEISRLYSYDYNALNITDTNSAEFSWLPYTAYGLIKNGKSVCQGISQLFYAVAEKLGIECDYCCSLNVLAHIWNYVKIDDTWYHVDLTWDETAASNEEDSGVTEATYHGNFMASDAAFVQASSHESKSTWCRSYGVRELPDCNSAYFESNHIFNINALCTITYSDGVYKFPVSDAIYIRADKLYTGPILVSNVIPTSINNEDGYVMYYLPMNEAEDVYAVLKEKNGYKLNVSRTQTLYAEVNTLYPLQYKSKKDGRDISVYLWNNKTQQPYSQVIKFTDN